MIFFLCTMIFPPLGYLGHEVACELEKVQAYFGSRLCFSEAPASRRNSTNMDGIRSSTWPWHLLMRRAHLPPSCLPCQHGAQLQTVCRKGKE